MASIQKRKGKRGTSYRVEVRLRGFPPQRATFHRLTDAKKWAQSTESAIRERRYFKTAESQKHTLRELIGRYVEEVLPQKSGNISQKHQFEWWASEIGDYTLADVTPALISERRDKLLRTETRLGRNMAPATVTRYLAALSHAFTIAVNEWGWLDDSPMRKVRKPSLPRGRVRFLSDDERGRLLEACRASESKFLYPIVVLAISTGMRKSEILRLTRGDVDFEQNRITIPLTKNKEIRVVPITPFVKDVLKTNVVRIETNLLFPSDKNPRKPVDIRGPWETAVRKAGITDFRFHDLRHSAASYLAMNGASLAEIAEVLGHKTLQMVRRYAHLSEAHTAGVVESMNEKIFGGSG